MQDHPKTIVETPDYDPRDPLHFALWMASGSPDPHETDADGRVWKPTIVRNLIGDGPEYDWPQAPSPEVTYARSFERSEAKRKAAYVSMKGAMAAAMQVAGVPLNEISAKGAAFFDDHSAVIFAWIGGGGAAFKNAVSSDSRDWLDLVTPKGQTVREVCLSFFT